MASTRAFRLRDAPGRPRGIRLADPVDEVLTVTGVVRWVLVVVLAAHGGLHLLGAAAGFGWVEVTQLQRPIGPAAAVVWLLAAVSVLAASCLLAGRTPPWWWAVAIGAAAVSQIAVATSWTDAGAGTVVNVLMVVAALYALASDGPSSLRGRWRDQAARALADVDPVLGPVVEADLAHLPEPVAAYVRRCGAVGRPRVTDVVASFHGRIRSGPDQAWMPFTGMQVNTFGPRPQRAFIMEARRSGLPVTVLHQYADGTATMRAKVLSAFSVVDAAGPEMDRGETVTVFNDLVVLAPAAIVDAPIRWTTVDRHHVRGAFTAGDQTVSALLTIDEQGDLVDFVSDDRYRASVDGRSFTPQRWSTPLTGHRDAQGRVVLLAGEGRWHPPGAEEGFAYVELAFDDIAYDAGGAANGSEPSTSELAAASSGKVAD